MGLSPTAPNLFQLRLTQSPRSSQRGFPGLLCASAPPAGQALRALSAVGYVTICISRG
jgi:hypothetical protein